MDEDTLSPATRATDDVLLCVFKQLAAWGPHTAQKAATARFIWFRNTLPLVCQRWHRLVLGTPGLWSSIIVDPSAEALHVKRSARQESSATYDDQRPGSGSSTPVNRGASPVLGSSPDSDSGGYWTSQYAPYQVSGGLPGGSPPASLARQHLNRLSLNRHHHHHRCSLSANAVLTWLQRHPAVASGTSRLLLDLGHHSYHDFYRQALEQLLGALPQLASVCLVGAVDGTDAYEPLGRLRCLRELELCCASQACLDGGLLALSFLPRLTALSVSLDIHPASPCCLTELPTGLGSLKLGSMWLEGLPQQLSELTDLTSITLERCQLEANPLPLLLTLPQLAAVTIRNASRPTPNSSDACQLLPMSQPQQQLAQLQAEAAAAAAAAGSAGQHGRRLRHHHHAAAANSSSSTGRRGLGSRLRGLRGAAAAGNAATTAGSNLPSNLLSNTSITSLSLVDVGLQQLPSCVSQLVALQDINLALNHDMGLNPGTCLPAELAHLQRLQGLCLGHCSLGQLPAVLALLTGLTRLELQGNALSVPGFTAQLSPDALPGFRHSLRVLDLGGQGSSRGRMRGIPSWVGSCIALRELRLGSHCLAHCSSSSIQPCSSSHVRGEVGISSSMHSASFGSTGSAAAAGAAANGGAPAAAGSGSPGPSVHYHSTYSYSPSGSSSSLARGSAGLAAAAAAGGPSSSTAAAECWLGLQQLTILLPDLEVLCIEGGMWEHRAVREALSLVRQLERQGSRLQVVLPL